MSKSKQIIIIIAFLSITKSSFSMRSVGTKMGSKLAKPFAAAASSSLLTPKRNFENIPGTQSSWSNALSNPSNQLVEYTNPSKLGRLYYSTTNAKL
ncbi:hypothetical protein HYV11_02635 [Candidatus Dependentiae bacterium]|nr:hypothetical protein [Candidatus Dependentiae bacterium]